jgi:N-acetylmuramoyl-L-alanine amidase
MARDRAGTKLIIIHCAATKPRQDIGVRTIHGWHLDRGIYSNRGPSGYHFVIRRSGLVELGRDMRAIGAHALGYNDESVGVCLVGGVNNKLEPEDNFTDDQFASLKALVVMLKLVFPSAVLCPHNMVNAMKACPSFDVYEWQKTIDSTTDELRAKALLEAWEHDK